MLSFFTDLDLKSFAKKLGYPDFLLNNGLVETDQSTSSNKTSPNNDFITDNKSSCEPLNQFGQRSNGDPQTHSIQPDKTKYTNDKDQEENTKYPSQLELDIKHHELYTLLKDPDYFDGSVTKYPNNNKLFPEIKIKIKHIDEEKYKEGFYDKKKQIIVRISKGSELLLKGRNSDDVASIKSYDGKITELFEENTKNLQNKNCDLIPHKKNIKRKLKIEASDDHNDEFEMVQWNSQSRSAPLQNGLMIPFNHFKRTREKSIPWSQIEKDTLEKGMIRFGTSWALILRSYGKNGMTNNVLENRTQIQLKDKARTIKREREKAGQPLGIFELASK